MQEKSNNEHYLHYNYIKGGIMLKLISVICLIAGSLLAQVPKWFFHFDTLGNDDQFGANSVVVGTDGNIYAAGEVNFGIPRNEDFTVVSLDPLGNRRWTYLYQGPGGNTEWANDIVYGADGNIYACGNSHGGVPNYWDFCVASLTTEGVARWVFTYAGPGGDPPDDEAYSLTYGADGNIYAVGWAGVDVPPNTKDACIGSLTADGVLRWGHLWNGPANDADFFYAVCYGADGNIYCAGRTAFTGSEADFLVISYSASDGTERWVFTYNGPGNDWDNAHDIFYGGDGNIYAIGTIWTSNVEDIAVISFTTAGDTNWVYHYDGTAHYRDIGIRGAWGPDGNIYVVGYSRDPANYDDAVVISLRPEDGTERWVYRYNNPTTNFRDWFTCITFGENNDIYAAGYTYEGGTDWHYGDILVVKLDTAGTEQWVYKYDGPATNPQEDYANDIAYGNGCVYIAGRSGYDEVRWRDFFVMALDTTTLGIEEQMRHAKKHGILKAIPNPFVNSTTISDGTGREFLIYDITGKLVATEQDKRIGTNLPAGVYFLKTKGAKETLRLTKIK